MKKIFCLTTLIALLGLIIFGCSETRNPTDAIQQTHMKIGGLAKATSGISTLSFSASLPGSVVLAGFTVHYDGRTVVNDQTTFTYTVTGPGDDMHFRLELPTCAPALLIANPTNGVTSNNDANINPGIEWHPSTGPEPTVSRTFSISYPGIVREGIVLTSVKTTNTTAVGEITGACARVYDISGAVYTDANRNGVKDPSETGIANVTVELLNFSNVVLGSLTTNFYGDYIFETLMAGDYRVEVDPSTVTITSTTYVESTSPTTLNVTLGPTSTGDNFGFAPKTSKLLNDLKFGLLFTDGATANFWKKQFQIAIAGKGSAVVNATRLQSYLEQIQTLLLPEPYQFPNGFQTAFDILNNPTRTEAEELRKQLLATELNHVSGHGIFDTDPELQLVIIGWCESLLASAGGASSAGSQNIAPTAAASSDLSGAIAVCRAVSSNGGGGDF